MKILLGNTGRGGEQCIFSAFVRAYRNRYQSAHIEVAICPEFAPLWVGHRGVDSVYLLEHERVDRPFYLNPIGKWYECADRPGFDIVELACEYGADVIACHTTRSVVESIYCHLKSPPCPLVEITRSVWFTPRNDEELIADDIYRRHGPDLVLMSHISNSAAPVQSFADYTEIASILNRVQKVACTGRLNKPGPDGPATDSLIPGTIDLRGISFWTLYALSRRLRYFVGPDTATTWLVSGMPGRLVSLRGDSVFPIHNTGLVVNGFRRNDDTLETEVANLPAPVVAARCRDFLFH